MDDNDDGTRSDQHIRDNIRENKINEAIELERRADELIEYGNSLPEDISTEAFVESKNLQQKAIKIRKQLKTTKIFKQLE